MKKPLNIEKYKGKLIQGTVVSSGKMNKTIVVRIERRVTDPVYGKILTKASKLHVHDADGVAKSGDIVEIKESRPISKTKSWVLIRVVSNATGIENLA